MYDIFYLGSRSDNWLELKSRFPLARRADTFDEIKTKTYTKFFWVVWDDVVLDPSFDFSYIPDSGSQEYIHIFKNGDFYDGICLFPKSASPGRKELEYRFFTNKKEVDIQASIPASNLFDIIFISYNEPNADKNFELLKNRFPRSKRIHGIKGIHQAHKEAAKLAETRMFYVVDGDAVIEDSFNFDYQLPFYEHDIVHVWLSKNPINNLVYGYGGVKLLPKKLTENLDLTSTDMTTSISAKFKVKSTVSNLTEFNTDEFNTWKSAFRECAKLSSGVIHNADPDDSMARLIVWTTVGANRLFGNFALDGAKQGRDFGFENSNDRDKLGLINDFDWLKERFDNDCKVRS